MSYTPDVWVIVEIKNKTTGKKLHKLLSGWYGGFAGSDSWRLNSGITKIVPSQDNQEVLGVHGSSGSIYHCHKAAERTSSLTGSILRQMQEEAEKDGSYEVRTVPVEGLEIDADEAADFY